MYHKYHIVSHAECLLHCYRCDMDCHWVKGLYECLYQWCVPSLPMLRHRSTGIDDHSAMKIIYWDDSGLIVKDAYPLAINIPSAPEFECSTNTMDELIVLNKTKAEVAKTVWSTMTLPCSSEYINISLYFTGHLDNDNILECMSVHFIATLKNYDDKLARKFENLINLAPPKPTMPAPLIVMMDPFQKVNTPME